MMAPADAGVTNSGPTDRPQGPPCSFRASLKCDESGLLSRGLELCRAATGRALTGVLIGAGGHCRVARNLGHRGGLAGDGPWPTCRRHRRNGADAAAGRLLCCRRSACHRRGSGRRGGRATMVGPPSAGRRRSRSADPRHHGCHRADQAAGALDPFTKLSGPGPLVLRAALPRIGCLNRKVIEHESTRVGVARGTPYGLSS